MDPETYQKFEKLDEYYNLQIENLKSCLNELLIIIKNDSNYKNEIRITKIIDRLDKGLI